METESNVAIASYPSTVHFTHTSTCIGTYRLDIDIKLQRNGMLQQYIYEKN